MLTLGHENRGVHWCGLCWNQYAIHKAFNTYGGTDEPSMLLGSRYGPTGLGNI